MHRVRLRLKVEEDPRLVMIEGGKEREQRPAQAPAMRSSGGGSPATWVKSPATQPINSTAQSRF